MITTINKPTRVTKNPTTAIGHIITNSFVENTFKTAIIKTCFRSFSNLHFVFSFNKLIYKNDAIYQYKRTINDKK